MIKVGLDIGNSKISTIVCDIKNDQSIKKQLLSIKRGDEITLEGLFGGPKVFAYYNGFEVFEIIN